MIQIFIGALIRLIGELLTTTILHSAWDTSLSTPGGAAYRTELVA